MPIPTNRQTPRSIATCVSSALLVVALALPVPASATTVCIDPGHGGRYSNANANGLQEKNVNLWVARALRDKLQAKRFSVVMTRNSDRAVTLLDRPTWNWSRTNGRYELRKDGHADSRSSVPHDDLQARCDVASRAGADVFVSIHCNGVESRAAHGTEDWASAGDPLGRELASYVQRAVVKATGLRNRGSFTGEFYVLRWSNMPAVLVENAFITNPAEARKLKSSAFRGRLAGGIANGISAWLATSPYSRLWPRRTGATEAAMAAAVSRADAAPGATVVIAPSDRWRDAAAAPVLANDLSAPLLFVSASGVPSETAAELGRLDPTRVELVGPDDAFPDAVRSQIASAAGLPLSGVDVLGGSDRRGSAAVVAERVGMPASGEVVLANQSVPEAMLQASAYAARSGAPLLLTWQAELGGPAATFIAAHRSALRTVTVFGARGDVLPSVTAGLPRVTRIYSADRTWWAATPALNRFPAPSGTSMKPVVADARKPLDRLVAANHAAQHDQPVMLTEGAGLPNTGRAFLVYRRRSIGGFEIVNSGGSIPASMDWSLKKAVYPFRP